MPAQNPLRCCPGEHCILEHGAQMVSEKGVHGLGCQWVPLAQLEQLLQAVAPNSLLYVSSGQLSHTSAPSSAEYEPGEHGLGSAEPTLQLVPGGQTMHSSRLLRLPLMLRTVWLAWVPGGHGCGEVAPGTQR